MRHALVFVAFLLITAITAFNATIDSPTGNPNSVSAIPFYIDSTVAPSVRYQQVYRESDFLVPGGPQLVISQLSFVDGGGDVFADLANVDIWLSTTIRLPDALSTSFAQNVGLNATLVHSGPLHLSDTGENFGIHIPLQTPFLYDRSRGNLLIEVRNYATLRSPAPSGRFMVANDRLGDSVSSVWAFNVNSPTGFTQTEGLTTLFTYEPVPEPAVTTLFIAGLCTLWMLKRRAFQLRRLSVA